MSDPFATASQASASDPFSSPGPMGGDGAKISDYVGSLLLITPLSLETGIKTSMGVADAIKANVVVLDGAENGQDHPGMLIFQTVLRSQLSNSIGTGRVLGRLGKGEASPGKSAPYVLDDPTEDDKAAARKYLASA